LNEQQFWLVERHSVEPWPDKHASLCTRGACRRGITACVSAPVGFSVEQSHVRYCRSVWNVSCYITGMRPAFLRVLICVVWLLIIGLVWLSLTIQKPVQQPAEIRITQVTPVETPAPVPAAAPTPE